MQAEKLLSTVMASDLYKRLSKEAQSRKDRDWIIVICQLGTPKRIGEGVAMKLDPEDYAHRQPDDDIWVFLYPLEAWQQFRSSLGKGPDNFEPNTGQGYVVVLDKKIVTGRLIPMPSQEMALRPGPTAVTGRYGEGKTNSWN